MINHKKHGHPSTPAARAACRKAGGGGGGGVAVGGKKSKKKVVAVQTARGRQYKIDGGYNVRVL